VVYVVVFCASAGFVLWPAGVLQKRLDVGPARSWRLMRGAVRGYILAHLVGVIPMVLIQTGWTFYRITEDPQAPLPIGAMQQTQSVLAVLFSMWNLALTATVYRARVADPATVADVFD